MLAVKGTAIVGLHVSHQQQLSHRKKFILSIFLL